MGNDAPNLSPAVKATGSRMLVELCVGDLRPVGASWYRTVVQSFKWQVARTLISSAFRQRRAESLPLPSQVQRHTNSKQGSANSFISVIQIGGTRVCRLAFSLRDSFATF